MKAARPVTNLRGHLTCDYCGLGPEMVYLPSAFNGVFCQACLPDVLNRVRPKCGDSALEARIDRFLAKYNADPVLCGTGRKRGRPPKVHERAA